jgi:TetR/AcrR family transcriptional repressor of mexCD-oprJ operon
VRASRQTPTTPRPTTRQALLTAASGLLAHDPQASLDLVAQRAGVGRATLFRQFATREALLQAVALEGLHELDRAVATIDPQTPTRQRLRALVAALVRSGDRLGFLLAHPAIEALPEVAQAIAAIDLRMVPLLEAARREGIVREDVPVAWWWAAAEALVYAAWKVIQRGEVSPSEAPDLVYDAILRAFGPSERSAG